MTEVQIIDCKLIIVCIYRSPHSDFSLFLNKLELMIDKVRKKRMQLILCGDWNLNFLQDNMQMRGVQNLLTSYKLVNIITDSTRFSTAHE
jgi:hypothetical protein